MFGVPACILRTNENDNEFWQEVKRFEEDKKKTLLSKQEFHCFMCTHFIVAYCCLSSWLVESLNVVAAATVITNIPKRSARRIYKYLTL